MQELHVIGVEDGALVVASDEGNRFRVPVDEVLHSRLRQTVPDHGSSRKLSPREIQSHIRSGMSAQDVAAITGASLEHIQKFEGPVLAEREFVIESALSVPVHTALDLDPLAEGNTFGSVIRKRLHDLNAINERWASWKEATGWVVKLSFTANQIEHDARWQFEPKKLALAPVNNEAITLSQQGEITGALIPRLRAVGVQDKPTDSSRFDSGAFDLSSSGSQASNGALSPAMSRTDTAEDGKPGDTADLLESLRRRRGQRELAGYEDDQPITGSHSASTIVDIPLGDFNEDSDEGRTTAPQPVVSAAPSPASAPTRPAKPARKGRTAMPSWDEIVFGARADE